LPYRIKKILDHWSTTEITVPFFFELVNLEIRVENLESEKKIKFEKKEKNME
jgi:hypothetical protein